MLRRRRARRCAPPSPAHLAGREIDVVHHPAVRRRGRGPLAAEVQPGLGRLRLAGVDHGRDEDVIAPHDGRAPADARHVERPDDVLGGAPAFGQRRIVLGDARGRPAELRPVIVRRGRGTREREHDQADRQQEVGVSSRHTTLMLRGWSSPGKRGPRHWESPRESSILSNCPDCPGDRTASGVRPCHSGAPKRRRRDGGLVAATAPRAMACRRTWRAKAPRARARRRSASGRSGAGRTPPACLEVTPIRRPSGARRRTSAGRWRSPAAARRRPSSGATGSSCCRRCRSASPAPRRTQPRGGIPPRDRAPLHGAGASIAAPARRSGSGRAREEQPHEASHQDNGT